MKCPCCEQLAKVYRRNIHSAIARGLIMAYRAGANDTFVHAPTVTRSGDSLELSKARYWGLVEEESKLRPDGGRAGWWRLTPLGVAFVESSATVPKYALLYDGNLIRTEGDPVTIEDALGDKFSLMELMAA